MIEFRLYLISDRQFIQGGSDESALATAIETACRAGVRAVQIREKDLDARPRYALTQTVRDITSRYETKLFVNDRVDIALTTGADGVHCPEHGISIPEAKRLLGRSRHVGASTHSLERAREAQRLGADFITFGPMFPTPSKMAYGPPQGLKALADVASSVTIPVFAIGGITPARTAACLDHGAAGVALISAVLAMDDIAGAVDAFSKVMGPL
ncbi:MAG: thiamine phosphate synthase [Candidatus Latescibacterota bacterium]|nr:MAG: thiamine phosphate synthase [Candidatus Latescibacterota bacterium]